MATALVFDVVCTAERNTQREQIRIAELELPAGQEIRPEDILRGWKPISEEYVVVNRSGEPREGPDGAPIIRDGVQLVCPRCYNPVLIAEPGGTEGVYLAPGAFKTGKASA